MGRPVGFKCSEETRKKMSKSRNARMTPEERAEIARKQKLYCEARQKFVQEYVTANEMRAIKSEHA